MKKGVKKIYIYVIIHVIIHPQKEKKYCNKLKKNRRIDQI